MHANHPIYFACSRAKAKEWRRKNRIRWSRETNSTPNLIYSYAIFHDHRSKVINHQFAHNFLEFKVQWKGNRISNNIRLHHIDDFFFFVSKHFFFFSRRHKLQFQLGKRGMKTKFNWIAKGSKKKKFNLKSVRSAARRKDTVANIEIRRKAMNVLFMYLTPADFSKINFRADFFSFDTH